MTNGKAWGPYLLTVVGAATGLGTIAMGLPAWAGSFIVACSVLAGAVLRLLVPHDGASLLAVRSRRADAVMSAVLGVALGVAAVSVAVQWIMGRQ
ncbi:hypothetical protein Ssi03_66280 [Sphaerisporangium siamense]|uniref:DUF3017 domain-containing protein n=1 Tax=Sphaerisporangium siamense TaxID=795645 RepID=A0A7W7DFU6_9ACTN|nr:DUF3017 domain-containing protein [Sphaerisporangium siamense]MBB4706007.1 hypothetical protein [Sphaerisporangium siamense]GII88638.1 hypothetical protein Ssi03_66280 [Sphaerisporangium siamense]